jgi:hypothetical protein
MAKNAVRAAALVCVLVMAGCNGIIVNSNDDALYELAGEWYNNGNVFAFEITQDGKGYIAKSKTHCTVSVLGNIVDFRDSSRNSLMGSFHYSIKNGVLTMTRGAGDFSGITDASSFIKSGTILSGGSVPVQFIGKWYTTSPPPSSPSFEITTSGIIISISESPYTTTPPYTTKISGNTVSVLDSSTLKGTFRYILRYDEMIITDGTDICAGLAVLSPFVKK